MGGLVVRCFLQNPNVGDPQAKKLVDKVFTYATPHNGIDFRLIGNVPGFFTMNDADNFNRTRMVSYLGLPENMEDVSNLNGLFDPERFFCLVGTNWQDYAAAAGWARRLTGPMSDGLVRIANATVYSQKGDGPKLQGPRAFVHRSHSGHYGIVNSEEGYQNLVRFLFGDFRVDGVLELDEITLPKEVQQAKEQGKKIKASYHFEVVVRVRGYDWELHRRTVREESAIFRQFDEMFPQTSEVSRRNPHLFSIFLSTKSKVNPRRASLGFAVDLAVLVPDYEIDGFLWRNQHYKGSCLFRDTVTIEATPDIEDNSYRLKYGYDSQTPNRATKNVQLEKDGENHLFRIPIESKSSPGLTGKLIVNARRWNG